jgi:spore coat polysaccharide biosynthesis protein SpsF (cytidylyltransferase family)
MGLGTEATFAMTFAVIVQARMGASRLPGKLMQFLGRETALVRCLDRCAEIPGVDEVVCAAPAGVADDPLAEIARRAGYRVSRGEADDVLARLARAAHEVDADLVMRVSGDCPFIDPALCGRVCDLYAAARDAYGADYACNNLPAKFPHGLDCELFSAERLYDAAWLSRTHHEREQATTWFRAREDIVKACLAGPGAGLERMRWTLDWPEDLAFVRAIYDELGEDAATVSWVELAALCLRRPDLVALNASRSDDARLRSAQRAELLTTPTRFALAA